MPVTLHLGKDIVKTRAVMIVIANATKYGSGAIINPLGSMEDELFEVIVLKKISIVELFKMLVSHTAFNPEKTEIFQTNQLTIQPRGRVHFQVDGEYLGKVHKVEATLIPAAIKIIVPSVKF
jgi:diacylglycerol kinase family enzyme